MTGQGSLNLDGFRQWATGNLVENRNRGIFAEWLVGQALRALDDREFRVEWDSFDLRYGEVNVEVKASGYSQAWNLYGRTVPQFSIARRKWTWVAGIGEEVPDLEGLKYEVRRSGTWIENDPPNRPADIYVFCLHDPCLATHEVHEPCPVTNENNGSCPATNENVADPSSWKFWVVPTTTLDAKLDGQKTIGTGRLDSLVDPVSWSSLRNAVDRASG